MAAELHAPPQDVPRHRPVMPRETLEALSPRPGGVLFDGTLGLGGHAAAWLEQTAPDGRVVGLDRDEQALDSARRSLARFGARATLVHADYRHAASVLDSLGLKAVDAALLDLGLGSHQLDDPARGFSFRSDGPLDMRFDRSRPGDTAADLIARSSEAELARVISEFGEERMARRIAREIVETRRHTPLWTTAALADLVRRVVPASRHERIDPATRTFQALRIAVNQELDGLGSAIETLVARLASGGRIAVIAFHSLEDRISKTTLRRLAEPCRCRRGDPCTCGAKQWLDLPVRRAVVCSPIEANENPRARSAKLRWGAKR